MKLLGILVVIAWLLAFTQMARKPSRTTDIWVAWVCYLSSFALGLWAAVQ